MFDFSINRFGFSNYRSIGETPVFINFKKKVNILIGANNSGKSNVLRAFEWLKSPSINLSIIDNHKRVIGNNIRLSISIQFEDDLTDIIASNQLELCLEWVSDRFRCINTSIDNCNANTINKLLIGFGYSSVGSNPHPNLIKENALSLGNSIGTKCIDKIPEIIFIPQFREIQKGQSYDIKGNGLIEMLQDWQHPSVGNDNDYKKFESINNLLCKLLHLDIKLEVSNTDSQLIIDKDGLRLPLQSFGTGIHELIIMACAIQSVSKTLVCLEEPEIHLHPRLQKEFIRYLHNHTDNIYFITTHSNALMSEQENSEIIHIYQDNDATVSNFVTTPNQALSILKDLGVSPSDILQTNYLIWVEGPSDRIYLNKWIKEENSNLIEGLHYSIMFYGGRLLNHLSFNDNEIDEFIQLSNIHQHSCIVIDSDRTKPGERLNKTKYRIINNFKENKQQVWVTKGREIENYISKATWIKAVNELYSRVDISIHYGMYVKLANQWYDNSRRKRDIDKIKIAKIIRNYEVDYSILDLEKCIKALLLAIEQANG